MCLNSRTDEGGLSNIGRPDHIEALSLTIFQVLKYNPSSWLVNPVADDPRARLVQLSSEFLMVLIVYNNNNNGTDPKNEYCHQLGRIHKPEDLQFIHQGMITALQSMVCAPIHVQDRPEMLTGPGIANIGSGIVRSGSLETNGVVARDARLVVGIAEG